MIYLDHTPAPPLNRCIRSLWYAKSPTMPHRLERMLPTGCAQVILNLAREFLIDYPEGEPSRLTPPSLIVGARSVFEIVDTSDLAELIGIVFEPGGFAPFASDAADRFSNRNISLEDVWGLSARTLRDQLRELVSPQAKFRCLEEFLRQRFCGAIRRSPMVDFALERFKHAPTVCTVKEVARSTGWSERRFSQVFREEVGFPPKVWMRIQRFQRAVRQLHAGAELHWAELALDCGYYDQSHFANEFRAFSGIDATAYTALKTEWVNHVAAG